MGRQTTIDVDGVRTLAAAARHDLSGAAPVDRLARPVADGGILLAHGAATAALGDAAGRLRERLDALQDLVGRLADAVDASATAMDTMDNGNADRLDQIPRTQTGRGWASVLSPDGESG
ncbi:MAG TPA: hypothetical protein VFV67_11500 [Actinophytocola sp.]|uniref:hypothetical protein n=1 Tax=Actinophytocola sp. TaxID=1872138 RepID=UPI002DB99AC9|nr:hypothetical protein [Actinophytocola sp.]HEU5471270.1 hypothetical protein [Actinophytocola sp.]